MRREQMMKFKEKLLNLKAETKKNIESQELKEASNDVVDDVDQATDLIENLMGLTVTSNYQTNLVKIEEALKRIEDGEYGRCLSCGKDIPEGRLEILPFTIHCIDCQNAVEKLRRRRN